MRKKKELLVGWLRAQSIHISLKLRTLLLYDENMLFVAKPADVAVEEGKKTRFVAIENGSNGREGEFSQRENCNENANSVHGRKHTASEKKNLKKRSGTTI